MAQASIILAEPLKSTEEGDRHIKKPELLSPAGDLEKLKIALRYGADAVYLGGKSFGMRAFAPNFSEDDFKKGISFAHARNAKVYVTVNNLIYNSELESLLSYLRKLSSLGVDAVIVSDPGVFSLIKEELPSLCCHLSTQSSTMNWRSASFWQKQGFKRVILARELSLAEIVEIKKKTSLELEVFVHGAMCAAYSGRCFLSSHFTGRSANRGECAQPCRWEYYLQEVKRSGERLSVYENEQGSYILSAKDLCMIEHIPALIQAGVDAFKIEGRMKGVHYVATVTRAYRHVIDAYFDDPERYRLDPCWSRELEKISHRPYGTGFYFGQPEQLGEETKSYISTSTFVGIVESYDNKKRWAKIEQRNRFELGDSLEIIGPGRDSLLRLQVKELYDAHGEPIMVAPHPQQIIYLPTDIPVTPYSMVRSLPR